MLLVILTALNMPVWLIMTYLNKADFQYSLFVQDHLQGWSLVCHWKSKNTNSLQHIVVLHSVQKLTRYLDYRKLLSFCLGQHVLEGQDFFLCLYLIYRQIFRELFFTFTDEGKLLLRKISTDTVYKTGHWRVTNRRPTVGQLSVGRHFSLQHYENCWPTVSLGTVLHFYQLKCTLVF